MTAFKTFFKILNKNKFIVITYTIFLIAFGGFNMQTSDSSINFVASKPNILVVNNDEEAGITKDLIKYIKDNSENVNIADSEDARNDALFYRDVHYIVYIPKGYNEDFLSGKNPMIDVKTCDMAQSSFAEMLVSRYIKIANSYKEIYKDENGQISKESEAEFISKINDTLSKNTEVEITSKLDTNSLLKATFYYNFASYSILASLVYVVALILSSFRNKKIQRRTNVSNKNYKKINRELLIANILFSTVLWLIYVLLSFVLIGKTMFSAQGILYIINSFIFTLCATTLALLIGNIVTNKNAINGIVNVIALGSSFLCGAFVPMKWLPNSVLNIAHILPSFYYISTNETIATLENIDINSLKEIIPNMAVMLGFAIVFIILSNVVSRKKRRED